MLLSPLYRDRRSTGEEDVRRRLVPLTARTCRTSAFYPPPPPLQHRRVLPQSQARSQNPKPDERVAGTYGRWTGALCRRWPGRSGWCHPRTRSTCMSSICLSVASVRLPGGLHRTVRTYHTVSSSSDAAAWTRMRLELHLQRQCGLPTPSGCAVRCRSEYMCEPDLGMPAQASLHALRYGQWRHSDVSRYPRASSITLSSSLPGGYSGIGLAAPLRRLS